MIFPFTEDRTERPLTVLPYGIMSAGTELFAKDRETNLKETETAPKTVVHYAYATNNKHTIFIDSMSAQATCTEQRWWGCVSETYLNRTRADLASIAQKARLLCRQTQWLRKLRYRKSEQATIGKD